MNLIPDDLAKQLVTVCPDRFRFTASCRFEVRMYASIDYWEEVSSLRSYSREVVGSIACWAWNQLPRGSFVTIRQSGASITVNGQKGPVEFHQSTFEHVALEAFAYVRAKERKAKP